jgi:hypothetical protein
MRFVKWGVRAGQGSARVFAGVLRLVSSVMYVDAAMAVAEVHWRSGLVGAVFWHQLVLLKALL